MDTNTSERDGKHRAAVRAAGLRPVQIWVPDTRRTGFAEECRRQSLMLLDDSEDGATLAWLAEAADTENWKHRE